MAGTADGATFVLDHRTVPATYLFRCVKSLRSSYTGLYPQTPVILQGVLPPDLPASREQLEGVKDLGQNVALTVLFVSYSLDGHGATFVFDHRKVLPERVLY